MKTCDISTFTGEFEKILIFLYLNLVKELPVDFRIFEHHAARYNQRLRNFKNLLKLTKIFIRLNSSASRSKITCSDIARDEAVKACKPFAQLFKAHFFQFILSSRML